MVWFDIRLVVGAWHGGMGVKSLEGGCVMAWFGMRLVVGALYVGMVW